jgi:single-stranded DNA-binding protein
MTVHMLVSGSLFRAPEQRTSQAGKSYVVATIKAAAAENASSDFWSVLAFGTTAGEELLRLGLNERVAIQGSLKLEIFEKNGETKISRTVFADHVLALRQPPREKKPKKPVASEGLPLERVNIVPPSTASPDLDDDIPF